MTMTSRRRLYFLAGKHDSELTSSERTELFRLFAIWESHEAAIEDQRVIDSATMTIDPSYPAD